MCRWLVLSLVALLVVGCSTVTWKTRLPYAGPVEMSIDAGQFLPGTDVQYVAKGTGGARLSIGGKQAIKRIGDSLDWKGDMRRGVNVDQTYRVVLIAEEALDVAGTVRIIVSNPTPQAGPVNESAPVHFELPVGYHVAKGDEIPGTTITYLGQTDQGAQLGNVEGYAYREVGDAIVWKGKLVEGVWIELGLRTLLFTDDNLDVAGTVDIWIVPAGAR
jgi:hypothetical protein